VTVRKWASYNDKCCVLHLIEHACNNVSERRDEHGRKGERVKEGGRMCCLYACCMAMQSPTQAGVCLQTHSEAAGQKSYV
jgi:hypothetical protein